MNHSKVRQVCCLLLMLLRSAGNPVSAHDGPDDVITRLTKEMRRAGASTDALFRRACEFRALRKYDHAARDLSRVLELDPSLAMARLELAQLQLLLEKQAAESGNGFSAWGDARQTLEPLLGHPDPALRAAALAFQGEIHAAHRQWPEAVTALNSALRLHQHVSWLVRRADAQFQAGQFRDWIRDLRDADTDLSSPVIRSVFCDALIVAVQRADITNAERQQWMTEAFQRVQEELESSRLKSGWQIRLAELHWLQNNAMSAMAQLDLALQELDLRLDTSQPDPGLLANRMRAIQLQDQIRRAGPLTSAALPPESATDKKL